MGLEIGLFVASLFLSILLARGLYYLFIATAMGFQEILSAFMAIFVVFVFAGFSGVTFLSYWIFSFFNAELTQMIYSTIIRHSLKMTAIISIGFLAYVYVPYWFILLFKKKKNTV